MRQYIFIIPLFCLLLGIIYLFSPQFSRNIPPELFVDRDALLLITQKNLAEHVDTFAQTPLGHTIKTIDYVRIARDLKIPEQRVTKLNELMMLGAQAINNPLIRSILGRQVSVALMSFEHRPDVPLVSQLLEHLLVICRPKQGAHVLLLLRELIGAKNMEEIPYGAHTIFRFPLTEAVQITAAQVKRVVLLSVDERLLRHSLDLYDTRLNSLATAPEFAIVKKTFAGSSFLGYVNLDGISPILKNLFENADQHVFSWLENERQRFSFYKTFSFGAWASGKHIVEKCLLTYDPAAVPEELNDQFQSPSDFPPTPIRLSDETIWYYWTNSYSARATIEAIVSRFGYRSGPALQEALTHLPDWTGISLEELTEAFGDEMLFAMKKVPPQELVPIPLGMVVIRCNEPKVVKQLAHRLIQRYRIPVRTVMKRGYEIINWGDVVPRNAFEPSIAFVGNYLLIANNDRQIKEFIAMPRGKTRLNDFHLFKLVSDNFRKKNNSYLYINTHQLFGQFKDLISWGGTMIAIEDRDTAGKAKIVIDRLINPLLEGLKMYAAVGSRKYVGSGHVIIDSTIIMNDQ